MTATAQVLKILVPGPPVAQQRPRFVLNKRKRNVTVFDPAKCRDEKLRVGRLCREYMQRQGVTKMTGPVGLIVRFYLPCPKSAHRVGNPAMREWHVAKPDVDNTIKLVMDGCKDLYKDDAQVCRIVSEKIRCGQDEKPRTEITFTELVEGPE